jgi:hypothetical protein
MSDWLGLGFFVLLVVGIIIGLKALSSRGRGPKRNLNAMLLRAQRRLGQA